VKRKFSWTVEITVDESWVADGFDPTADDFKAAILKTMLRDAYEHEVAARIVIRPQQRDIDAAQGYTERA